MSRSSGLGCNGQLRGRTRLTFVATLCSFLSTFVVWNFCSLHTFACRQIERDAVAAQLMHPAVSNAGEPIIANHAAGARQVFRS